MGVWPWFRSFFSNNFSLQLLICITSALCFENSWIHRCFCSVPMVFTLERFSCILLVPILDSNYRILISFYINIKYFYGCCLPTKKWKNGSEIVTTQWCMVVSYNSRWICCCKTSWRTQKKNNILVRLVFRRRFRSSIRYTKLYHFAPFSLSSPVIFVCCW